MLDLGKQRRCKSCKTEFIPNTHSQVYCEPSCRVSSTREKLLYFDTLSRKLGISGGSVGAINELRVSCDLMMRGFYVFRNLSPNGPCDLLILKNDEIKMVEVKTGYENGNNVTCPKAPRNTFDILAVATPSQIVYYPPLEDKTDD